MTSSILQILQYFLLFLHIPSKSASNTLSLVHSYVDRCVDCEIKNLCLKKKTAAISLYLMLVKPRGML